MKISPFVRLHLASRQWPTGHHPDANLLVAFAERNLSRSEHAAILTHLGECPECREVLALNSAVNAEDSPRVFAKRRSTTWAWGLAVTAALVCIVISTVWWPTLYKTSPEGGGPSETIISSTPPSAAPAPLVSKAIERDTTKPKFLASGKKQASPRRDATDIMEGPPTRSLAKSPNEAEKPSELDIVPQAETTGAAPNRDLAAAQSGIAGPATQLATTTESSTIQPTPSAKPLLVPNSMFPAGHPVAPVRAFLRAPRVNGKTVWSLVASATDGKVQKSDDGGKTWHIIPVDEGTRFYALSATGPNVWVGGTDGKLFHSTDEGIHWTAISVADGDTRLNGIIIGIHAGGESITVKTDSGAIWTTDDGGMHWHHG